MTKFFNKHKTILGILFLACIFRLAGLANMPLGFHADEVRVGWNTYSILKTGADDWGNYLALAYNTFGDFRPTGIFYMTLPSMAIFGPTVFATRLPSALLGALTIIPLFMLSYRLYKNHKVAYIAAILLALSPWHITTSRATSEVVMALFFTLWGLIFLLDWLKKSSRKTLFLLLTCFVASFLLYHSARMVIPVWSAIIMYFYTQNKFKKQSFKLLFAIIGIAIAITTASHGMERFTQVSLAQDSALQQQLTSPRPRSIFYNKYSLYGLKFLHEYTSYLSSDFLIGDAAKPLRYRIPNISILPISVAFIFIAGLYFSVRKNTLLVPLLLLLIAPLPAALTGEDAPNLHRAFFMLPGILIIAAFGLHHIKRHSNILFAFIIGVLSISCINFWGMYMATQHITAQYRSQGTEELATYLLTTQFEGDIVITDDPDSPYPWIAFLGGAEPAVFNDISKSRNENQWKYKNYIFSTNECPAADIFDKQEPSSIIYVVDGPNCEQGGVLKENKKATITKEILDNQGKRWFTIWRNEGD